MFANAMMILKQIALKADPAVNKPPLSTTTFPTADDLPFET